MYNLILQIIARTILYIIGWRKIDEKTFNKLTINKRAVIVFSHTSYMDFYLMVLYLLAYPNRLHRIRTLIKPQPFSYAGGILTKLGAIPSTRLEDKNGGAVDRIVKILGDLPEFLFLISPKGTIIKNNWRSGYYNIAKRLNIPLLVAGVDYVNKAPVAFSSYDTAKSEADLKPLLQRDISNIIPLYPNCEVVDIVVHNESKRGIINYYNILYSILVVIITSYYTTNLMSIIFLMTWANILFMIR